MSYYTAGRIDCRNGIAPKMGMPEDYYRGYNHEYQLQAIDDARTA